MSKHHNHPDYIANRKAVLKEQPICTVCNRQPSTQADHIIPVDAGGSHQTENLRGICAKCNNRLGHNYVTQRNQYRQTIRNEALAQNGIKTQKQTQKSKPFFYDTPIQTPTQLISIPNDPDQPGLAVTGHDVPRLETVWPDAVGSWGAEVGGWAQEFLGVELMPWQQRVLDAQLLYDSNGDLLHRVSLVSTARQCGKSTALKALLGWWFCNMAEITGRKQVILSTAHRLDLAVSLYEDLAPILRKRVNAKTMSSYGRNSVTSADLETKWLVRAANNSVGHGLSVTLCVADEIWDISRQVTDAGILPSQRAQRSPLLSCWSTAGTEHSTAMMRWRDQGLKTIDSGKPSSLYFAEWSPPDIDPMTPAAWAYANPALGKTLTLSTLHAEAENPDRANFLRASCNLWVASDRAWIQPGIWTELKFVGDIPAGGCVAVETSLDDSKYFGVRAVVLPDRRVLVTQEFVCDTHAEMNDHIARIAKNPAIKFAISPTIDIHWPLNLQTRKMVVGYAELLKFTPRIKAMINEKLLWHTGETMLAEHVQRAVAVRSQISIALSSQRSAGEISLARCMIWASALASKPTTSGKPMIVIGTR